ncbi:MAG: CheR family methyltransferase [Isosphaeraceae bacterium]
MPVVQASDGQKVEPDHVYVIPPGKHLTTVHGHLRLDDLPSDKGKRVAVDLFFRSLADTHGPHAAAVVLSGADADGAIGIKRIKERGGLTIAQDPDEAEHSSMPRCSINTGMVDWVLPVAEMPRRLLQYRDSELRLKLPPEDGPAPSPAARATADESESAFRDILLFLRTRTGCDFSSYKRATIVRRIGRRMQVNGVADMPTYMSYLRSHAGESGALLQDLLISVTNFLRDREAFHALEGLIPKLFEGRGPGDALRIWIPACATGEEAYSIAILLMEHAEKLDAPPSLQLFACDLDDTAIRMARLGHYPEAISADVSEERLRRFFVKDHNGYRVRRELREHVLFATHDLLRDAPFSRMDLISCRNLLIYLNREAQDRVLDTFHFSLRPDGYLFLGTSESVDDASTLFRVVDKRHRIYSRLPGSRAGIPLPSGPSALLRVIGAQARMHDDPVVHGKQFASEPVGRLRTAARRNMDRASLADLHFRLIERYAPPSVIVNADQEIVHLSEHAGQFLALSGGEPTMDLLRLVLPSLRVELRTALFRASEMKQAVESLGIPAEINGQNCLVDVRVAPAHEIAPDFLLVMFEKRLASEELQQGIDQTSPTSTEPLVRHLERELEQVKARLRDTVEQYEASTEELKASNEELQAMNEELRSATEELETSREELQSINEELTTVNQEMKVKIDEIALANSDLQNLMASTSIATLFLNRELEITRYTPSAVDLFYLIPSDLGRPLAHVKHRLDYPELVNDAAQVLRTLVPIERETRSNGGWFQVRLQPYRTLEDHIGGLVLTLVDTTDRRHATEALREQLAELERFNAMVVGRETRMIELKKEVNELCSRLGEPPRYNLDFVEEDGTTGPQP